MQVGGSHSVMQNKGGKLNNRQIIIEDPNQAMESYSVAEDIIEDNIITSRQDR